MPDARVECEDVQARAERREARLEGLQAMTMVERAALRTREKPTLEAERLAAETHAKRLEAQLVDMQSVHAAERAEAERRAKALKAFLEEIQVARAAERFVAESRAKALEAQLEELRVMLRKAVAYLSKCGVALVVDRASDAAETDSPRFRQNRHLALTQH